MGGWLGWMLLGGFFLFLMFRMFRGGGCCAGHGSHGGHDGRGSDGHEELDGKTPGGTVSRNRSHTAGSPIATKGMGRSRT